MEMTEEELRNNGEMLQEAVVAVLDPTDVHRQQAANQWLSAFVTKPEMWTVALYLAFPPPNSSVGQLPEVKYFVFNLLLSKLRSDWVQLNAVDAREIFEVCYGNMASYLHDKINGSRGCIVLCAAAAVAGGDCCTQLIYDTLEHITNEYEEMLALDLLTVLADETLHRSRALAWEVGRDVGSCYPSILKFLEKVTSMELREKMLTCLERWLQAGITLSELYSEYPSLFNVLLASLLSQHVSCTVAACTVLSELVSSVDLLPDRDAAVRAVISALLRCKSQFSKDEQERSHGICYLLASLGCSEPTLISKGGTEELLLVNWMIETTGRGIETASVVSGVWPRLASVTSSELPRVKIFSAVFQAIVKVAMHSLDFDGSIIDEDDFYGFRSGVAEDALGSCYQVLEFSLLSLISEGLVQVSTWQHAEVYLYIISTLHKQILSAAEDRRMEFLNNVLVGDPSYLEIVTAKFPDGKLIRTACDLIKGFAEWIAANHTSLEKSVNYCLTALASPEAKSAAAEALREIFRSSAPHLAAARCLSPLMVACGSAITTSLGGLQTKESVALIEGLAAVASALPSGEAEVTIRSLTFSAAATVKEFSNIQITTENQAQIESALRLITAVVESGGRSNTHPAIPVLHEIWSSLDILNTRAASNVVVSRALCDLWSVLATRVGVMMVDVLPRTVEMVSAMYTQHLLPSSLHCLSKIVALASNQAVAHELETCLATTLHQVTSSIEVLEIKFAKQEGNKEKDAVDCLGAICSLGSSCLRHVPRIFVPSDSLTHVFRCAIGLIQNVGDSEPSSCAAKFLSEAIFAGGLNDTDRWSLPQELVPFLDKIVVVAIPTLIEVVIKFLLYGHVTALFIEALADILYGLAVRHPGSTEGIMLRYINSPQFAVRPGLIDETTRRIFITECIKRASRSRRIFQELVLDFSRVVQGLSPAEVLYSY